MKAVPIVLQDFKFSMKRLIMLTVCAWFILNIAQPVSAASLEMVAPETPVSLDPHAMPSSFTETLIYPCYQRLTAFRPNSTEVEPSLAVTWRVSTDGRLYTFVLHEGMTFSDGRPVDAKAIALSFQRSIRMKKAGPLYFPYLRRIEIIGPRTLRFTLDRPWPPFLQALASTPGSIVSPGAAHHPPGFLDRNTLGSGLYRVETHESGHITLQTRKDAAVKPQIDQFTLILQPDPSKSLQMLRDGAAQVAAIPPSKETSIQEDSEAVHDVFSFDSTFLSFNMKHPWLAKHEARQALSRAIDYEALIQKAHYGAARRMFGPIPLNMWGHREDMPRYDFDPEKVAAYLKKAGRPDHPLILIYTTDRPERASEAMFIQNAFISMGIQVRLNEMSVEEFEQTINRGGFDLALGSVKPLAVEPFWLLNHWFRASTLGSKGNWSFYRNPEVESLLSQVEAMPDRKKRLPIYYRIQEITANDAPYIFLYQKMVRLNYSKQLTNFRTHPAHPYALNLASLNFESQPDAPDIPGLPKIELTTPQNAPKKTP